MDGGEKAGAKGQRGSDSPTTPARSCWATHTPDDVRRPPCEFLQRIMSKSTQGEDATTYLVVQNLGTLEMPGKQPLILKPIEQKGGF